MSYLSPCGLEAPVSILGGFRDSLAPLFGIIKTLARSKHHHSALITVFRTVFANYARSGVSCIAGNARM